MLPISCCAHLIHNCAMRCVNSAMIQGVVAPFRTFIDKYHDNKPMREAIDNTIETHEPSNGPVTSSNICRGHRNDVHVKQRACRVS